MTRTKRYRKGGDITNSASQNSKQPNSQKRFGDNKIYGLNKLAEGSFAHVSSLTPSDNRLSTIEYAEDKLVKSFKINTFEQCENMKKVVGNIQLLIEYLKAVEERKVANAKSGTNPATMLGSSLLSQTTFNEKEAPTTKCDAKPFDVSYVVVRCEGDLNHYIKHIGPLPEYIIREIGNSLLELNRLGVIHGDIKFQNIMYKREEKELHFRLHDFDGVFLMDLSKSDNISPIYNYYIDDPMITIMFVSPIYYLYRSLIKKNLDNQQLIFDRLRSQTATVNNLLHGMLPRDNPIHFIFAKCQTCVISILSNIISESDPSDPKKVISIYYSTRADWQLKYLVQYSDSYSWAISVLFYVLTSSKLKGEETLNRSLFMYAQRLLDQYFRCQITAVPLGGARKKRGGSPVMSYEEFTTVQGQIDVPTDEESLSTFLSTLSTYTNTVMTSIDIDKLNTAYISF